MSKCGLPIIGHIQLNDLQSGITYKLRQNHNGQMTIQENRQISDFVLIAIRFCNVCTREWIFPNCMTSLGKTKVTELTYKRKMDSEIRKIQCFCMWMRAYFCTHKKIIIIDYNKR